MKCYQDSDVDRSCRDGQFTCRILRGPIMPSWSCAHSSIQDVTLVTRWAGTRGPMPVMFQQIQIISTSWTTIVKKRERKRTQDYLARSDSRWHSVPFQKIHFHRYLYPSALHGISPRSRNHYSRDDGCRSRRLLERRSKTRRRRRPAFLPRDEYFHLRAKCFPTTPLTGQLEKKIQAKSIKEAKTRLVKRNRESHKLKRRTLRGVDLVLGCRS